MTCEIGCAARIEKKVAASEGVAAAKVDFDAKTAYVSFDPNKTSFANIQSVVEKLGGDYKVGEAQANSPYSLEHMENKQCEKTCDKPCCAEKKKCDKSCTKECCASKKEEKV
jgi:copper chaperone CopZ